MSEIPSTDDVTVAKIAAALAIAKRSTQGMSSGVFKEIKTRFIEAYKEISEAIDEVDN